jgi:hypothetical protein
MMNFYGLNQAEFIAMVFDGAHTASTGLWFHYDAVNNIGSGQVFFHKCFFYYCVAAGAASSNGSAMVKLGDAASSFEVAGYVFEKCSFNGGTFESGGTQACVMALESGVGNTEQFAFRDCNFSTAYYGFEFDSANNELIFENCQFAAVFAPAHVAGICHITMYECATELNNGGSLTKQGYFLHGGGQACKAIIDSCEMVIDTTNNAQNAIVSWSGGHLEIANSIVDGTGGGHTASTVASLSVASLGVGNACSVDVRKCLWVNVGSTSATPQIPVFVGGTNKTDYVAGDSQLGRTAIQLHANMGAPSGGSSVLLPDFNGWPPSLWTLAPWSNIVFGSTGLSEVYRGEPRTLVTCYEIDYTALAVANTTKTITLGTVRQRQGVTRVFMESVTPFSGGAISAVTASTGYTGGTVTEWLLAGDVLTAAVVYGKASGDLGAALSTNLVQGMDVTTYTTGSSPGTAKTFGVKFTSTTANLNALTAGVLRVYVTTEFVDYL